MQPEKTPALRHIVVIFFSSSVFRGTREEARDETRSLFFFFSFLVFVPIKHPQNSK